MPMLMPVNCVVQWSCVPAPHVRNTLRARRHQKHHIFNRKQRGSHGMRVVDLGSAPGGWLQVAVRKLGLTSTDTARRLAAVAAQQRSEAKAQRLRPMLRRTGSRSRSAPQSGPTSFFGLHASEVLGSEEADVDAGARAGVGLGIGDAGDAGLESSAPAANTVDALTAARACVIGVDLLPVEDVPGALFVRGDLRHNDVQARIRQLLLGHRADVGACWRKCHWCCENACSSR